MSFSSKILHTINHNLPIWDSIVTKDHFDIKAPAESKKYDRIIEASKYIKIIQTNFTNI